MKALRTPLWIINLYQTRIRETEQFIVDLRKAGLYGLVPENAALLESLKHTLSGLIELDQNTK